MAAHACRRHHACCGWGASCWALGLKVGPVLVCAAATFKVAGPIGLGLDTARCMLRSPLHEPNVVYQAKGRGP